MEFSLDHTNYYERFFDWLFLCQIFALGLSASLFFCQANVKLAPKHWTIIVIENSHKFLFFWSSAVESCVCLLSRLVPVLNDTHGLSRIIHQLLNVSLCVNSRSWNLAGAHYWTPEFSYLLYVIDLIKRQRSRNFRSFPAPNINGRLPPPLLIKWSKNWSKKRSKKMVQKIARNIVQESNGPVHYLL